MDSRSLPPVALRHSMRRAWSTILLVTLFGLCVVSGRAHAQGTGQISGRVTDASTGAPLANIGVRVLTSVGGWGAMAATDASGVYTATGLMAGTYCVKTFGNFPYLDKLYDDLPNPYGEYTVTGGTVVSVTDGTTTNGIDFRLTLGGTITGTATDASTGAPLANIPVRAFTAGGDPVGSSVATNAFGEYTIPGLVTGVYYLRTTGGFPFLDEAYKELPCPVGGCPLTIGTGVSVTAGMATSGIDFTLVRGATITGTVRDAVTGAPLANVLVSVCTAWGCTGSSSTNGSGVYALTGLATGSYYLKTSSSFPYIDEVYQDIPCPNGNCSLLSGTGVEVTAGTTADGIDFRLTPGGIITGTVTVSGSGTPLANVSVRAYTASGSAVGDAVRTDVAGVYAILGLVTGTFYVRTSIGSPYYDELYNDLPCWDGSCVVTAGTGISVTAGQSTGGIDFVLDGQGTLTGTVTDAATGAPLENVRVQVRAAGTGAVVATGWTREAGAYTVNGLAAGPYYVQTSIGYPYRDELYNDVPCPEGSCTVTAGTTVVVNPGATTAGIDFSLLTEGGTITGTVTDARTGAPLVHVSVHIYTANGTWRSQASTNVSGVFSVIGLEPGTYYAKASNSSPYFGQLYNDVPCPAGNCTVTSGTGVAVVSGTTTSGIDFRLTPGGTVTGTVTDSATGVPLANVSVQVRTAGHEVVASAMTNASGVYTVTLLAAGTYYVLTSNTSSHLDELYRDVPCPGGSCALTSGTGVAVTDGGTTSGIDLGLARGGTITGTVTDAGTGSPLRHVYVRAFTASGSAAGDAVSFYGDGVYTIIGLATGTYHVRTSIGSPYLDELYRDLPCPAWNCTVTSGTGVAVTAGATTSGIDFSLGPGGTITGTVTDADSGAPLAGVSVAAVLESGSSAGSSVTTSASGVYTLTGLATGTYYVRTSNGAPYLDELYHDLPCLGGSCLPTAGTGVEVTAGSTTSGIDFGLVPGGSITGAVTDAGTGEALANVTVLVYTASGSSAGSSVRTNASGVYTATGLATGTYFVQTSGSVPYLDQLYTDLACPAWNCTVTSGTGVVVTAGTTTNGIDFALAMGGRITGTVTDAGTGAPLAYVAIYVRAASGSFGGQDWTDTLGAYTIAGLETGNYYVQTQNSPGYVDELYNDLPCAEGCTRTSGTGVSVVAGTTTSGIDFGLALPPVTPVITWETPAAITQGTALGGTQLNASAGVLGSVVYTPPAGTVLAAGTHTLSVTFTPTNATLYTTASKTVTLVVNASGGGGGTFKGPSSGGPATGSVSGTTLTYNGATYPIVGGKVTFPDCTVYIAMTSGMLIPVGTAPGCTPGGSGGGSPVAPVITWGTPAAIIQGTALSGTQLNATAAAGGTPVAGTFVYTPAAGTLLAAGTHTLSVTFTPVDTARYTTASRTVTLTVTASGGGTFQGPNSGGPATGVVSGSTLTYNGATYPIVGGKVTFPDCTVYIAMTSGLLIPAGTAAGCTPGGGGGGAPVAPVVTWGTPAAIIQGTALSATQLNATAAAGGTPVAGTSVYTPPAGTVLAAGTHTLAVTFTPTDTTRYTTASRTVTLTVTASGGGTFQGPSSGGPATGSVSGSTLTYNGATYPIVGGKVTFPDCTVYIAMTSGMLIPVGTAPGCTPGGSGGGSPVTPVITWGTPAAIIQWTALGGAQLNATASAGGTPVAGTFVYTPPAGTVLAVGTHTLAVTFTPTNTTLYTTASASVTLVVTASGGGGGTFRGPNSGGPATGVVSGSTLTYNGATYPIVGGKVTFPDCTVYIAMTSGMLIPVGTAPGCTPGGGGGGSPVAPVLTWGTPAAIIQGAALGGTQLNASASVPGSFVYTPAAGTVLAAGTHTLSVTFTPTDTTRYTTASRTVTLTVTASGGGTFQGPSSGGPATGVVSGSTLTYNGATYPIVGGKVTFPDCTVYIAMTSGMLIPVGTAPGCTPSH